MNSFEDQTRSKSYNLWESAGRPEGRSDEFWYAAEAEINAVHQQPVKSLRDEIDDLVADATWSYVFSNQSKPISRQGYCQHRLITNEDVVCLHLSNGQPDAPSGGPTQGYNFRVSDEMELAASGKPIEIRILARASGAAETRFACAYSTAEVGNSRWMWRTANDRWSPFHFKYSVPKMIEGRGDFLGLLPDMGDLPGIEIAAVAISVAESNS